MPGGSIASAGRRGYFLFLRRRRIANLDEDEGNIYEKASLTLASGLRTIGVGAFCPLPR